MSDLPYQCSMIRNLRSATGQLWNYGTDYGVGLWLE